MATATGMTVAEYLATDYQPDREYVDGEVLERNVGQGPHSYTQGFLMGPLLANHKRLGVIPLPEQRVQVAATHFRVPDICLIRSEDFAPIVTMPPLLCIEILSPEDRWPRIQESIDDYLQFGVPEVWVIDPEERKAWTCTLAGARPLLDSVLRWKDLAIELSEILPPRE